jgi:hypothetical protein
MKAAFSDAEVVGFEALVDALECDPKDRHVLVAAVRAEPAAVVATVLLGVVDLSRQAPGGRARTPTYQ